ncbi:MAG: hypothetical protein E6J94_07445 [Methanobacteriota archaeon]|nr:MAG: hypothetical protein E6J99_08870 [Euryarchaeota archaeon]TMA06323.1 MAG: hypothetical protein E6J94_07445 [Euryarchaeota archaeon]
MGSAESSHGSTDKEFVEFDHWLYGAVLGTGYTQKAVSKGLDAGLYDQYLRGHYTPIRAATAQSYEDPIDLQMIHPVRGNREVLLSRITRGPPDEAGRPTFANHTVVGRIEPLKTGAITLESIYRALGEFDRRDPDVAGEMPLLRVPVRSEAQRQLPFGTGIHRHLTFPAVETLATRIMADPASRTLLLCRNTTPEARNATLNLVFELLCWGCGLPILTAISETPRSSAMNFFNLVVAPRGVRADSSWAILESALAEPVLPRVMDRDDVYQKLTATVRQSPDLAAAR